MSTKDRILSSALHGEALLLAQRPEPQPLIDHLAEQAKGRLVSRVVVLAKMRDAVVVLRRLSRAPFRWPAGKQTEHLLLLLAVQEVLRERKFRPMSRR